MDSAWLIEGLRSPWEWLTQRSATTGVTVTSLLVWRDRRRRDPQSQKLEHPWVLEPRQGLPEETRLCTV